jgi:Cyclic nucleotide-binding domain
VAGSRKGIGWLGAFKSVRASRSACGATPYEPAAPVLMGMIGVDNALVGVGLYTLLARLVPERLLGRVFGTKESLITLSVGIGALVAPFVIDLLGVRGALAVLGLVAPVVALVWRRLQAIDASIVHRDDEIQVLRKVAMFRPLPMPAIDNLALHVDHVHFAAGQEVFRRGDRGDRFYVIEDGEADVIGERRLIRTLGPGDGFGEIALLHDTPRTATVRARTRLALYTLDRRHFVSAVSDYQSSAREAGTLMHDRLGTYDPRRRTTR